MTPDLLDYFFNQRTRFSEIWTRDENPCCKRYTSLNRISMYCHAVPVAMTNQEILRQHTRYSVKCPGTLSVQASSVQETYNVMVTELSEFGFKAVSSMPLPVDTWCDASIQLGKTELSALKVMVVRQSETGHGGRLRIQAGRA